MSHFTTITTRIKDTAALRSACEEMHLPLLQNAEPSPDISTGTEKPVSNTNCATGPWSMAW